MPFTFRQLDIPDVVLIEPQLFGDERGFFTEMYKANDFLESGINHHFVQDNLSTSQAGVLRGLHYQLNPKAQGKLVRAIRGSIFDVVVDIRSGSKTYGKWVSAILSDKNHHMLWVPPGFAHGVLTLENNTCLFYKVTEFYSPTHDRNIHWDDPDLGIDWPLKNALCLSEKDTKAPFLKDAEINFSI